jgi:hypothetical protein
VTASLCALLAAASAATVEGRVLHQGDAAPVVEAVIVLADGVERPVNPDGRFTVELPDGVEVVFFVRAVGHRPAEIIVTPPVDGPVLVWLRDSNDPGEIVVEAFRPTADLSRHHVDGEMAYETPGTYDDAIRLVQSLPGVAIQREFSPTSGDVTVRGSLPGDSRTFYDGIEVPYLYHFNQYASVFPASQLADLELFPSTFGARYGDAVGAIVEARSEEGRPDNVTGSVGLNLVMLGVELRAPLPKRWWIGGSARRSFQDLVTRGNEQYGVWPRFYDFSARAEHEGDRGAVSVFTAGAGDRYDRAVGELDLLDPVDVGRAPSLRYQRDWQLVGFRYRSEHTRLTTALLHDDLRASLSVDGEQHARTLSLPTRLDARYPLSQPGLSLETGLELRPEIAWTEITSGGVYGPLVTREAPAIAWQRDVTARTLRLRAGAYTTLHAAIGPARVMPGLRVGVDSSGAVATFEPRFAARLRLADHTELRGAIGRYQQRPETIQLAAFPDLPTTDAWQAGLGLDQAIAGRLELSVDGYVKALRQSIVQPADGAPIAFSRGRAYGVELTARYRLRETFFLWGWLAYGRAQVRDGDAFLSTAADQPWSGGLVASWNIIPAFNVAVRYRAATGLPFTAIDGSTYDATTDAWIPRFDVLNGARLPFYQKIDLHFAYTHRMKRWSLQAVLDLWIVPKGSAQLYPAWSYDYREQGYVNGPTFVPLVGVRASF